MQFSIAVAVIVCKILFVRKIWYSCERNIVVI